MQVKEKTDSFLVFVFIVLFPFFGSTQSNEITIRFIGNCGLHISDGSTHIYSDFPYKSGAFGYMEYDDEEIVSLKENAYYIFTHKHADHYYRGKMNRILKERNGKKYGKWNIEELENLAKVIPGFRIEALKTKHAFSCNHYSYIINWHGKKIFISGDTEAAEAIAQVKDIDWAFVPAWIIRDAYMEKDLEIDAKMIGIYHIGPKDNIDISGAQFLMLDKQGETIQIPY